MGEVVPVRVREHTGALCDFCSFVCVCVNLKLKIKPLKKKNRGINLPRRLLHEGTHVPVEETEESEGLVSRF